MNIDIGREALLLIGETILREPAAWVAIGLGFITVGAGMLYIRR